MSKPKSRRSSGGGKAAAGEYEGELNAAGKRDGKGICRFVAGDVYDGEWKDGKMHGKGRYKLADGDIYEGIWSKGLKQGPGTMWYASGRADVVSYDKDADGSVGARWSDDRQMAWRLDKGEVVDEITLDEAQQIADQLGVPVPAKASEGSPLLRATGGAFPGSLDAMREAIPA